MGVDDGADAMRAPWNDLLLPWQAHLICLARALIANPEVLILHMPVILLDEISAKQVLGVLRDMVDSRGVEQNSATFRLRKPRTVVMTVSSRSSVEIADRVLYVDKDGSNKVGKCDITDDMFG